MIGGNELLTAMKVRISAMDTKGSPRRQPVDLRSTLVFAMLSLLAFTFLYPLYFMILTSLKDKPHYVGNQFGLALESWSLTNYSTMLGQFKILEKFGNTAYIVVFSLIIITVFAVYASYAFAKLPFRGSHVMFLFLLFFTFIPGQVTMIPMYVVFSRLGLINNPWSVILSYCSGGIPGGILLMTAAFRAIPKEVMESAQIDGVTAIGMVPRIVVPMGQVVIIINLIMGFIGYWNDLFLPLLYLQNERSKTVIVALAGLVSRYANDPTYQMAGMILAIMPVMALFLSLQRFIIKGLIVGALK